MALDLRTDPARGATTSRPNRRRHLALAAPLVVGALLFGACAKAEEPVTSTTTEGTTSDASAADGSGTTLKAPGSTETTGRSTTSSSPEGSTTTDGPTTTGVVTPGAEAFCARLLALDSEMDAMNSSETTDMSALEQEYLTFLQEAFAELAALAPDEVKADVTLLSETLQGVTSMAELETTGDDEELDAASQRMETWTDANCGFDLSEDSGSGTGSVEGSGSAG